MSLSAEGRRPLKLLTEHTDDGTIVATGTNGQLYVVKGKAWVEHDLVSNTRVYRFETSPFEEDFMLAGYIFISKQGYCISLSDQCNIPMSKGNTLTVKNEISQPLPF